MAVEGGDLSVIGRLLEEISWEASRVTQYREGGRDLEDALTAQALGCPALVGLDGDIYEATNARTCRGPRGRAWRPTRSLAGARYSQNRWREREMIRTYGPPGQRGLPSRKILIRHVLRNASAPALTVLGMQFVGLLGGAVIVEQIFGLPGIGSMAVKYTTRGDIPIIMGLVMVTVIGVIIINLLVDIVIGWLNPKARVA